MLTCVFVGESGLGKTTFMNTLFNSDLTEEIVPKNPQHTQTVQILPSHYGTFLSIALFCGSEMKESDRQERVHVRELPPTSVL